MKTFLVITLMAFLPAMAFAQRESVKSSNKYNSAALRVSDKKKQAATSEKFNGQKPDAPAKSRPNSDKTKPRVQGATESGNRVKNPKTNSGNL
ncbi:hypothetical protein HNV11_06285 [Spirosoma taeanense]|uniref:Uncharacterized protein n=1 Tax=Spirosoma taeanense TaxID=2735870 RepID=A0A6M5Y7F5_9BACT|nr:hypothetical protein [Spirosoma taeanense]QJW89023.1 hypothetical protein HNV11_06285 [Spirosoma taeanense]